MANTVQLNCDLVSIFHIEVMRYGNFDFAMRPVKNCIASILHTESSFWGFHSERYKYFFGNRNAEII